MRWPEVVKVGHGGLDRARPSRFPPKYEARKKMGQFQYAASAELRAFPLLSGHLPASVKGKPQTLYLPSTQYLLSYSESLLWKLYRHALLHQQRPVREASFKPPSDRLPLPSHDSQTKQSLLFRRRLFR
jgi:hypothetical protein